VTTLDGSAGKFKLRWRHRAFKEVCAHRHYVKRADRVRRRMPASEVGAVTDTVEVQRRRPCSKTTNLVSGPGCREPADRRSAAQTDSISAVCYPDRGHCSQHPQARAKRETGGFQVERRASVSEQHLLDAWTITAFEDMVNQASLCGDLRRTPSPSSRCRPIP